MHQLKQYFKKIVPTPTNASSRGLSAGSRAVSTYANASWIPRTGRGTRLAGIAEKITSWVLPYTCFICKIPSDRKQDICQSCYNSLPILTSNSPQMLENMQLYALFYYQKPIMQSILQLKFNQRLLHARILGELLIQQIQQVWYQDKPLPDIIIPMPLHHHRLKERGFNQALEIARPIAKALNIPLRYTETQRIKSTLPQAMLHIHDRQQNIKDAFIVTKPFAQASIAVIDDVVTTGETLKSFCKILKQNGAGKIDIWCCAQALLADFHAS